MRERQQQISAAAAEVDHNAACSHILREEHGRKVFDLRTLAQAASVDRLLDGGVRCRVDGAANRNRASPPRHTVRVEPLRHRRPVDLHTLVRRQLLVCVRDEGQPLMKPRERRVNQRALRFSHAHAYQSLSLLAAHAEIGELAQLCARKTLHARRHRKCKRGWAWLRHWAAQLAASALTSACRHQRQAEKHSAAHSFFLLTVRGSCAAGAHAVPLAITGCSNQESCIPAATDASHTFRAGDRPRGANPPTTSDLVWEKTNRGKSWRKQKKEVSQEKETLADNIDALARRVRQEAARVAHRFPRSGKDRPFGRRRVLRVGPEGRPQDAGRWPERQGHAGPGALRHKHATAAPADRGVQD